MTTGRALLPDDVEGHFDRLAALEAQEWNHNRAYHARLLAALPERMDALLEVGCGAGEFTREVAARARRVVALDLSAEMLARARAAPCAPSIEWRRGDFLAHDFGAERFDAVVSIATLHHLPLEAGLARMAELLRPGGKLCALDVFEDRSLAGWTRSLLAVPTALALRLRHTGRLRPSPAARAAWAEHARHDRLLTPAVARERVARALPGASVRRLLLWRYLIEWTKPR